MSQDLENSTLFPGPVYSKVRFSECSHSLRKSVPSVKEQNRLQTWRQSVLGTTAYASGFPQPAKGMI